MDRMQSIQEEAPKLCSRCQEFYGSPQNLGLCSRCHRDFLKEKIVESICSFNGKTNHPLVDEMSSLSLSVSEEISNPQKMKRCECCNKKVGLIGLWCKCGGSFCGKHRYPEEHACKFDYKTRAKAILIKENPLCKADKLFDRV